MPSVVMETQLNVSLCSSMFMFSNQFWLCQVFYIRGSNCGSMVCVMWLTPQGAADFWGDMSFPKTDAFLKLMFS